MIYEFMRMMAGSSLCKLSDYYNQNQFIFNIFIVIVGFLWILYKRKSSNATNY
ncbi:hypothetical protein [Crassaminicella profunda]|uniref:hypothetical protein n=1 Tax=Crassaminicella profunda TaxID=1286698 RepID=UPI001CA6132F|nr:hypothetical protein [Crassaminicella profunda]QZY55230.1 hypothetical protein K7H06_19865 [Crassaminicella profunda]